MKNKEQIADFAIRLLVVIAVIVIVLNIICAL